MRLIDQVPGLMATGKSNCLAIFLLFVFRHGFMAHPPPGNPHLPIAEEQVISLTAVVMESN
jgi:hypothetical protein